MPSAVQSHNLGVARTPLINKMSFDTLDSKPTRRQLAQLAALSLPFVFVPGCAFPSKPEPTPEVVARQPYTVPLSNEERDTFFQLAQDVNRVLRLSINDEAAFFPPAPPLKIGRIQAIAEGRLTPFRIGFDEYDKTLLETRGISDGVGNGTINVFDGGFIAFTDPYLEKRYTDIASIRRLIALIRYNRQPNLTGIVDGYEFTYIPADIPQDLDLADIPEVIRHFLRLPSSLTEPVWTQQLGRSSGPIRNTLVVKTEYESYGGKLVTAQGDKTGTIELRVNTPPKQ